MAVYLKPNDLMHNNGNNKPTMPKIVPILGSAAAATRRQDAYCAKEQHPLFGDFKIPKSVGGNIVLAGQTKDQLIALVLQCKQQAQTNPHDPQITRVLFFALSHLAACKDLKTSDLLLHQNMDEWVDTLKLSMTGCNFLSLKLKTSCALLKVLSSDSSLNVFEHDALHLNYADNRFHQLVLAVVGGLESAITPVVLLGVYRYAPKSWQTQYPITASVFCSCVLEAVSHYKSSAYRLDLKKPHLSKQDIEFCFDLMSPKEQATILSHKNILTAIPLIACHYLTQEGPIGQQLRTLWVRCIQEQPEGYKQYWALLNMIHCQEGGVSKEVLCALYDLGKPSTSDSHAHALFYKRFVNECHHLDYKNPWHFMALWDHVSVCLSGNDSNDVFYFSISHCGQMFTKMKERDLLPRAAVDNYDMCLLMASKTAPIAPELISKNRCCDVLYVVQLISNNSITFDKINPEWFSVQDYKQLVFLCCEQSSVFKSHNFEHFYCTLPESLKKDFAFNRKLIELRPDLCAPIERLHKGTEKAAILLALEELKKEGCHIPDSLLKLTTMAAVDAMLCELKVPTLIEQATLYGVLKMIACRKLAHFKSHPQKPVLVNLIPSQKADNKGAFAGHQVAQEAMRACNVATFAWEDLRDVRKVLENIKKQGVFTSFIRLAGHGDENGISNMEESDCAQLAKLICAVMPDGGTIYLDACLAGNSFAKTLATYLPKNIMIQGSNKESIRGHVDMLENVDGKTKIAVCPDTFASSVSMLGQKRDTKRSRA